MLRQYSIERKELSWERLKLAENCRTLCDEQTVKNKYITKIVPLSTGNIFCLLFGVMDLDFSVL